MLAGKHSKRVIGAQLVQLSKFTSGQLAELLHYLVGVRLGFELPRPIFFNDYRVLEAALLRLQADVLNVHLLAAIHLRVDSMTAGAGRDEKFAAALEVAINTVQAAIKANRFSKFSDAKAHPPLVKPSALSGELVYLPRWRLSFERAKPKGPGIYLGVGVFQKDIPVYHPPVATRSPARLLGDKEAVAHKPVSPEPRAAVVFSGYKPPVAERSVARLLGK